MEQKKQSPRNWLVIFLATLVGIWVVSSVLYTLNRMLWSAVLADAPLFGERLPIRLFGAIVTLGTIAVLILVITKLGKWNVLWPAFAGFVLEWLWSRIWPYLFELVRLIYTQNDFGHAESLRLFAVLPAVTALIYLAAATLTFVLVRRRGKALHTWLTTFLITLVSVWLFRLVSSALLNTLRWLVFAHDPWQWNRITASINVMVALASLAALIVVVHKPRKWSVLWPAPVFFVIVYVWRSHIMPYLHSWFFERAIANDPLFWEATFQEATSPEWLWLVTPLLYLAAAMLITLLVRRHNQKAQAQPDPEQTMLT
ncbi:MAG: hypothetical protein FWB76_02410 [Oscillospiraceae bacterium]|nr:hypothetical protein [Oscillospiraceae bacterium]